MTERASDASGRQPFAITPYPSTVYDVFNAVHVQTNLHGYVNVPTCTGFVAAIGYALTSHYWTTLPLYSIVVGALFWGAVGYIAVLCLSTLIIVIRNHRFALILRDSGLAFVRTSSVFRCRAWSDVQHAWWDGDLIAFAIRGEALFVSLVWDHSASDRRRFRRMLLRHLNRSDHNASMYVPEREQ